MALLTNVKKDKSLIKNEKIKFYKKFKNFTKNSKEQRISKI